MDIGGEERRAQPVAICGIGQRRDDDRLVMEGMRQEIAGFPGIARIESPNVMLAHGFTLG
jgi:hypothetical protein